MINTEEFVKQIHTTDRKILLPWDQPLGRTCLLDYIGLSELLITEVGCIFYRDRLRSSSRSKYITQGYIPISRQDSTGKYPWVMLRMGINDVWFPLNLLLGWSFHPQEDTSLRYFSITDPKWVMGSHTCEHAVWTSSSYDGDGEKYIKFVDDLYRNTTL